MRKDLENFVKSVNKSSDILKAVFLDWPEGEETLVLIGKEFPEKFGDRPGLFLQYLPNTTSINLVCYSLDEWKWVEDDRPDFLQIVNEFGSVIFDRQILDKLLSRIKSPNPKEGETNFKTWIDHKVREKIEIEMIGKSFFRLAKNDLKSAKILFENDMFEQSVFLASQSIEKFLKGYLAKEKKNRGKTHSLPDLYINCFDSPDKLILKKLKDLEKMYLILRYPTRSFSGKMGRPVQVSKRKAKEFLFLAREVYLFSK